MIFKNIQVLRRFVMLIIENEIVKIEEAKTQIYMLKECL